MGKTIRILQTMTLLFALLLLAGCGTSPVRPAYDPVQYCDNAKMQVPPEVKDSIASFWQTKGIPREEVEKILEENWKCGAYLRDTLEAYMRYADELEKRECGLKCKGEWAGGGAAFSAFLILIKLIAL